MYISLRIRSHYLRWYLPVLIQPRRYDWICRPSLSSGEWREGKVWSVPGVPIFPTKNPYLTGSRKRSCLELPNNLIDLMILHGISYLIAEGMVCMMPMDVHDLLGKLLSFTWE